FFPAGVGGGQVLPFFHRLALEALLVQAALAHHRVEGHKAVVPLAGDLDLVGRNGRAVHLDAVAGEPGLDVLGRLDLCILAAGADGRLDGAAADVPPQQGAAHHHRAAHGPHADLAQPRPVQCHHKHSSASPRSARCFGYNPCFVAGRPAYAKTVRCGGRTGRPGTAGLCYASLEISLPKYFSEISARVPSARRASMASLTAASRVSDSPPLRTGMQTWEASGVSATSLKAASGWTFR